MGVLLAALVELGRALSVEKRSSADHDSLVQFLPDRKIPKQYISARDNCLQMTLAAMALES